jgi:hypothetical protein
MPLEHVIGMRFMLLAVLLAGCLPEEADDVQTAEGDHLIVHVVSDAQFDHVSVELVDLGMSEQYYQLTSVTGTFDYDHWETLNGYGPHDVKIMAEYQGTTIGGGEATNIEYRATGDGSELASISMHLMP